MDFNFSLAHLLSLQMTTVERVKGPAQIVAHHNGYVALNGGGPLLQDEGGGSEVLVE